MDPENRPPVPTSTPAHGRSGGRSVGCLLGLLQARVASRGELRLELLDPARGVDKLQLAREKGVADIADVDLDLGDGAVRHERIATSALDDCVEILRVNAVFHGLLFFFCFVCLNLAAPLGAVDE